MLNSEDILDILKPDYSVDVNVSNPLPFVPTFLIKEAIMNGKANPPIEIDPDWVPTEEDLEIEALALGLAAEMFEAEEIAKECFTCDEDPDHEDFPLNACPESKRPCGHHCNCSWINDCCHFCGKEWDEDEE